MTDTLTRWAAVVPVLVEAGCAEPPAYIEIEGIIHGCLRNDQYQASTVNNEVCIAVLEKWFREVVVPHFTLGLWELDPPFLLYRETKKEPVLWGWNVNEIFEKGSDPSEQYIACAEALASVVKENDND